MLVPVRWLKDFVDIDISAKELSDRLTMTGTKTETLRYCAQNIKNVVIGKIAEILPHPNADKLVVTKIDVGTGTPLQIVTGAQNISVGDVVPVALHNSTLPSNEEPYFIKIKKGKLRGVESEGMLCSSQELGIDYKFVKDESKNGIWLLDKELPIGEDAVKALELDEYVIDFEITSNRPDCLSIIGVAREAAATIGKKINIPENKFNVYPHDAGIAATVENPELCPRYMLREIRDVKIEESPAFIKKRLIDAGLRPINNIVDITNFVMLEYGQPMHAFDEKFFSKGKVVIKCAKDNDTYDTLDGQHRKLDKDMLMITDGEDNLAVAGVMGGLNSEITENTKNVIFESANFDSESIRLTSKKLGLRTDASSRYEKGIDLERVQKAMDRACYLIDKYGWGKVSDWIVDTMKAKPEPKSVDISLDYIVKALGNDISAEEVEEIFKKLYFEISYDGKMFKITPPSFRLDISLKADLVEEVVRMFGYDKVKPVNMVSEVTFAAKSDKKLFEEKSKNAMNAAGLTEVISYSFISKKELEILNFDSQNVVKLINPLGEDSAIMRTTLIPNMLKNISSNAAKNNEFFAGFEIGNIFFPKAENEEPLQKKEIIAGLYGQDESFYTMKSRMETYFTLMRINERKYVPENLKEIFHPYRCAAIFSGETKLGYIGQINPILAETYGVTKEVYMAVIDFEAAMNVCQKDLIFTPISKYPSIKRDISFVIDKTIDIAEIEKVLNNIQNEIISEVELFDIYEGDGIETGKKSVSYSITYQSFDKTLTDKEVTDVHEKIISTLIDKLNVKLRD